MALTAACFGRDVERDGWPSVSVIMPIRNEAEHLEAAVTSVLTQDYPEPFEVCLAVGPSDDGTESVAARLAERESRVLVVPNPAGVTPVALNTAIAATSGEVVVRVDGHAALSDGYIRRAVETMIRTGAVNVGGMQVPTPETPFEEAVAAATTSWLGTGGASYRVGGDEGPVDTVYLGVFDRAAGDAVGWFAPDLIRNQDYELNIRLREAGGTVWFDPSLSVGYRPRGSWTTLTKQYFEYGRWKAEVLRRHPESLRMRQLVPAVLPLVLAASTALGLARRRRWLLAPAVYAGVLAGATRRLRVASVLAATHLSWGTGVLSGFARQRPSRSERSTRSEVHVCDSYAHLLQAIADLAGRRPNAADRSRPLVVFIDDHLPLDAAMRRRLERVGHAEVVTTSDRRAIERFSALPRWAPQVLRRNVGWSGRCPISPFDWDDEEFPARCATAYVYHPGFFLSKVIAGRADRVVMRDSGYANYVTHRMPPHKAILRMAAGMSPFTQVWGEERWVDAVEVARPDRLPARARAKATEALTLDRLLGRLDADVATDVARAFWGDHPLPEIPDGKVALLVTQPIDDLGFCSVDAKAGLYGGIVGRLEERGFTVVVKPHPRERRPALTHLPSLPAPFPIEAWTWLGQRPFDLAISLNSASLVEQRTSLAARRVQLVPPTKFYAAFFDEWPTLIARGLSTVDDPIPHD